MNSRHLRGHADALHGFARETRIRANAEPDNLLLQLAAKNQADAAHDIERDLAIARAEEAGELVDLRLIGPRADGSISLDWFINAMAPLSKAWKLAAHRLRYGQDTARVGADVVNALNLKLAGMGYGSTRIFVTGNAVPDLTGDSLLQAMLTQTFRLLNAQQDDFYDAVDAIGGKSAHQLSEFLKALDDGGLAAEFAWQAPQGRQFWEGRPAEITRLRALLDTLRDPELFEETLEGSVAGITDTGRIDIRTAEGKVTVRFPLKLTEEVQRLTIKSQARVLVQAARYWDSVEKKDIYKRLLLKVM